jgi:hypothetical protein
MTVECFVFRPKRGAPDKLKFAVMPRVGEGITLPDREDFIVESIVHMAREPGDQDKPTVQMHLRSKPMMRRKFT